MSVRAAGPRRGGVVPQTSGVSALPKNGKAQSPASLVSHRAGVQSRIDGAALDVLGQPLTPDTGIAEAIGLVRGTLGVQGGRILLGEGTWHFSAGLLIDCPKLELFALYPGRTIFRRTRAAAANDSLLQLAAEQIVIHGITFQEPNNTTEQSILVTADKCSVVQCTFSGVYGAVELASADYCFVTGNRVETYTAVNPIDLTGTSAFNVVANNVVV